MEWGRLRFLPLSLIVSCVFSIFLFPVILLPLWLYKLGVEVLAKLFLGLTRPLSYFSTWFATDALYTRPTSNVVCTYYLSGPQISLPEVWKRAKKVIDGGKFPEITSHLKVWMRIPFWTPCSNFKLGDHISVYEERDPLVMRKLVGDLVYKPWKEGAPLWEVSLWPNYWTDDGEMSASSAITIRVHHSMVDIYAGLSFLQEVVDPNPEAAVELEVLKSLMNVKHSSSSWQSSLLTLLDLIFLVPGELLASWTASLGSGKWSGKLSGQGVHYASISTILGSKELMRIAAKNGTNISVILTAGVTVALRNVARRKCLSLGDKDFYLGFALPRGYHPGTLTNHMNIVFLRAPISVGERKERVRIIAEQLKKFENPALSQALVLLSWTLSILSTVVGFNFAKALLQISAGLTIWPSGSEGIEITFNGAKVLGADGASGQLVWSVPGMFASSCWNGKVFLNLNADQGLFTQEDVVGMLYDMAQEVLACGEAEEDVTKNTVNSNL